MMRKLFLPLLALLSVTAQAEVWQARYGVAETFNFKLFNADGTLDVDEADGGTEVSVSCNEGAETTATNDFVDEGTFYSIALTSGEMSCERISVVIAATTTEVFFIQTSANASAMTPTYEANVASATTGAIENQDFATAPGASGGLLISGSNAGTTTLGALTITGATTHTGATAYTGAVTMAAGLAITQSASNTAGLSVTGNGTGNGATFTSGSGATGNGVSVVAASTNGNGLAATGTGTGSGLIGTAGATGDGIEGVGGSTSGAGLRAAGTAGNSPAATLVGQGSAAGLLSTGGATGHGISAVGGATSGSGLSAVATTSGAGIVATGIGTTQAGIAATGGSTTSAGISATGGGTGSGILATSGSGATGNGITATAASTNGHGISGAGVGTGSGVLSTGGATGHGMRLVGGSTSGNGISTAFTAPSTGAPELGINVTGTLSGTHSSTTADLGANAPGTVSDVVGHTVVFPTRNLSRAITAYDTATGIATFAAIDADITLTNADPWLLYATAPSTGGSGATAQEVWEYSTRTLTALDEDTTTLDLNATTIGTVTTATSVTTVNGLAANVITAAATATDFGTEVANANWALDATGQQTQGTFGQVLGDSAADTDSVWSLVNTNLNATVSSRASQTSLDTVDDFVDTEIGTLTTRLGTPSDLGGGASVAANLGDIEGQTDDIGVAGAGLTATDDAIMTRVGAPVGASISADIAAVESGISWNSAWDTEVQSEANDALVANLLDQLLLNTYNPASPPGAADSLLEDLVESDAGTTRFSVNALEQAPSGGGGVADWSADERTAIRSILGIPASGTTPDDPTTGILDTTRDAVAGVQSDTNDIQTRIPAALVSGRMDSSTGAMAANVVTAAAAATDLTTELQTGLATSSALSTLSSTVGTPAGASVSADIAVVEGQTDDIGIAGAGLTAVDDAVLAAIAALNNLSANQLRDLVIEDQGSGVSLGCALSVILAYAAGDLATTGTTPTYEDPSGTETRATGTIASTGNRTMTITCPTY